MKDHHLRNKTKQHWYSLKNGLSPSKTLGLDGDVRRVAMMHCTAREYLGRLNGECCNCRDCALPPLYATIKEHAKESWVDMPPEAQQTELRQYYSPDFCPPPGYSNFPESPERQEWASIQSVEVPDPDKLKGQDLVNAAMAFVERAWELRQRGWRCYLINRTVKRAIPAAAKALLKEPPMFRDSDFRVDKQIAEAKAEAAKSRKPVTITVEPVEPKQTRFDDWAKQMEEYHKTGREFPLLKAIREALSKYPCLRNALFARV